MPYARTIAIALAATSVAAVLVPTIASAAPVVSALSIETKEPTAIEPLPEIETETDEIIDGVRIVADTDDQVEFVTKALDKFANAGYPIDNTEVRFDEDACDGSVGYHAITDGHHLVVICLEAEWTLLHELGHVWSDLYLDEVGETAWVELRGLDSWDDDGGKVEWGHRGTEHLAETIAFGLLDREHTPSRVTGGYDDHVEHFAWLFGMEPLHRKGESKTVMSLETRPRVTVVNTTHQAVETPEPEETLLESLITSGYTFPVACGYDR